MTLSTEELREVKEAILHLKQTGEYTKDINILKNMYSFYRGIADNAYIDPRFELMEQCAIEEVSRIGRLITYREKRNDRGIS